MKPLTTFPAAAMDFYADLANNNNKAWWQENKEKYDAEVLAPLSALLSGLEPRFGPGKIFRPYRDMRYSRGEGAYKTAQGMFLSHYADVGYYFQVGPSGLSVGGGYRSAAPAQLARYRAAVDASASGTALAKILEQLEASGFTLAEPELKTLPRGFPKNHPRPQLLRHKTLNASRELNEPVGPEINSVQKQIAMHWEQLRPLVDWVIRYAAP